MHGTSLVASPELPRLALLRDGNLLILVPILLKFESVPPHAASVIIERDVTLLFPRDEAVRQDVASDPALDTTASSVDGRVLQTPGLVAGPVVRRLGRHLGRRGFYLVKGLRRGEVEVGRRGELVLLLHGRVDNVDGGGVGEGIRFARPAG